MALPQVIDQIRPSIVQITYTVLGLTPDEVARLGVAVISGPCGTGVLVNQDAYVLTAKHVIDGIQVLEGEVNAKFASPDLRVGIGLAYPNSEQTRGNFSTVGFDVVELDPQHDLALLRMRKNPFREPLTGGIVVDGEAISPLFGTPVLRVGRPADGDPVAISGYPLGEPVLITNAGVVASSWAVTVERPSNPGPSTPQVAVRDTYLADVQSNPGNSGGPVYSQEDSAIVGMLVAGKTTSVLAGDEPAFQEGIGLVANAGLSVVVPSKYLAELRDRNGVAWAAA